MGLRFQRSIRLLPHLHLNFSKSGISFSLGAPGASLNIGPKGTQGSLGIPGTGLSYRKTMPGVPGTGLSWGTIFSGCHTGRGGSERSFRWLALVAVTVAGALLMILFSAK